MLADSLTKPLSSVKFLNFTKEMIMDEYTPVEGGDGDQGYLYASWIMGECWMNNPAWQMHVAQETPNMYIKPVLCTDLLIILPKVK